jgi:CheY-like chemotaxis protein
MDIQLPGINGVEALHQLRADPVTSSTPVIAITASVMTQDHHFPAGLVDRARAHLVRSGKRELEQLVLWGGYYNGRAVALVSLLLPETVATWGSVTIVRTEQPVIADWLYDRGQLLFVEAHTHGEGPWATELSEVDRKYPISRQTGFLTLIVPNYARDGISLGICAVWECRALEWARLSAAETARLRVVEDTAVRKALFERD